MESKKRVYNDRFLYADPLAKSSSSRSTRYHLSKRKAEEGDLCCSTGNDATAEAVPVDAHCGDMCDCVRLGTSNDPSEREPDVVEDVHSKEISGLGNEVEVVPVVHNAIELQSALPDENVIREYCDEELDQEGGERDSDNVVCLHKAGYDMEGARTAVEEPLFSGDPHCDVQ